MTQVFGWHGECSFQKVPNTAVQSLFVQHPVQQRRRTSAIKQSSQRTVKSHCNHGKDSSEHQRTTCVESPLRTHRTIDYQLTPTLE